VPAKLRLRVLPQPGAEHDVAGWVADWQSSFRVDALRLGRRNRKQSYFAVLIKIRVHPATHPGQLGQVVR
jgi:hypothetical protein